MTMRPSSRYSSPRRRADEVNAETIRVDSQATNGSYRGHADSVATSILVCMGRAPRTLRRTALSLAWAAVVATIQPSAQSTAIFEFHSNAWLNLHHVVRANVRGMPPPTGVSDEDSRTWAEGVAFYKPYAGRDLLGDDGMVEIKNALRGAEGKASLDGIA